MQEVKIKPKEWNYRRVQDILLWIAAIVMAISVGLTFATVQSAKDFRAEMELKHL